MSAQMLKMIADMKAQLAAMEAALSGSAAVVAAAPAEPKPKRELSAGMKAWHEHNKRLDALLKDAGLPFKRVAEAKQFASEIWSAQKQAGSEMGRTYILKYRRAWALEHAPKCPTCHEDATEEPAKHGACATTFIQTFIDEGKGDKDAGMKAWLKASGIKTAKSDSEEEGAPAAKKAGRPKMTEEQKAAAAAAKAAMTPEEKAAAVAKRAAAKAAREAKKPAEAPKKVAWADPAGGAATATELSVEEQIDALIESM